MGNSFKDLIVWQKSMDLVVEVYKLVKLLPKNEMFALSNQIRRAVVSIPSNIAEGQSRNSNKEFCYFLSVAQGSKSELETQLIICEKLNYMSHDRIAAVLIMCDEIGKMLSALKKKFNE